MKILKKVFLVAMVTIKLSILDDFGYFRGFSLVHTRGSGAGAPDMGHVIHQSDRLFNPYVNSIKKLKNQFQLPWLPYKGQFWTIFEHFG